MRAVLDTCVLFPTTVRQLLLKLADAGMFEPLWSPRILEEWRRAEARRGGELGIDLVLLRERFPNAEVQPQSLNETLPDMADVHVLEAAVTGHADALVTFNIRDFPTRTLARHNILRRHPDAFLSSALAEDEALVRNASEHVHADAEQAFGRSITPRSLYKKCGLPRFGKSIER